MMMMTFLPCGLFRHFPQYIDGAQHPSHISHFSPGVIMIINWSIDYFSDDFDDHYNLDDFGDIDDH